MEYLFIHLEATIPGIFLVGFSLFLFAAIPGDLPPRASRNSPSAPLALHRSQRGLAATPLGKAMEHVQW